jgi:hypothetical protein
VAGIRVVFLRLICARETYEDFQFDAPGGSEVGKLPADNSPEQVIIQRVEYTDGSVWTRPSQ